MEFAKWEWQDALSRYGDDIFKKAVLTCRDHFEMPPTLPQLMQICREIKKRRSFFVVKQDFSRPDPEVVQAQLKRCRAILSSQRKEKV